MGGIVAASVMFPINCVAHKTRRIADKYRSDAHCDTCPRVGARLCLVPCSPLSRSHSHNSLPEPCPAWPHSNGLIAVLLPGLSCYTGPGLPAIPPCLTYTSLDMMSLQRKIPLLVTSVTDAIFIEFQYCFPCMMATPQSYSALTVCCVLYPPVPAVAPRSHFPAKPPPHQLWALGQLCTFPQLNTSPLARLASASCLKLLQKSGKSPFSQSCNSFFSFSVN